MGLPLHSPRVRAEVKTNEVPIRERVSPRATFTSASALSFCSSPGRLFSFSSSPFASHSLSRCCPRPLFCWHNRLQHTPTVSHTHTHWLMGTEGCNWSKSRMCLCYLDDFAAQDNRTSLHFNVVFLLFFISSFISFSSVLSVPSFRGDPFVSFVIQMKSHRRRLKNCSRS